jgi:2-dehydropantoate 2-reductase
MRIFVIGSGGVGGYFGGVLAKAGHDVTFLARGDNYIAMRNGTLLVKSVEGDFTINPVKVIESISEIALPDLILFCVKTYDTELAARELAKVITRKTMVITFQNGVDNDLQIKKFITTAPVFPGVAYIISQKSAPGIIEQTGGLKRLIFGDRERRSIPRLKKVEKIMKDSGIDAVLSDDIEREIWKKFMFICPFSGMTAMYRKTIGEILENPRTRKEYEECLKETIAVARSLKVPVAEDAFETAMKTSLNTNPASKSSLLIDIQNERKNEIETLNGTLVRLAHEQGIPVPVNEKIYETVSLY